MEPDSNAILYAAHELGIRRRRRSCQMPRSGFTIHREKMAERQLQSAAVAPGANGIGETDGLCAALESEPREGVGHEALAEASVDRPQH
jgi:hypothetical protein